MAAERGRPARRPKGPSVREPAEAAAEAAPDAVAAGTGPEVSHTVQRNSVDSLGASDIAHRRRTVAPAADTPAADTLDWPLAASSTTSTATAGAPNAMCVARRTPSRPSYRNVTRSGVTATGSNVPRDVRG